MKAKVWVLALAAAAALSACGGGGGDSSGSGGSTVTPASVTKVSGTAATGAAVSGATVNAKCASGSGSAVTADDGTFTLNIENAVRPCVLSVQVPNGPVMHSVVGAGTDLTAVANVSPLTELLTAALVGSDTSAFFDNFGADAQSRLTPENIGTAASAVTLSLSGAVDTSGFNPLTDPLVAAHGASAGNALDQLLDKLAAIMKAANTSLAELSAAVAANPGGNASGPISTILQASAQSCANFRSGKYYAVILTENDMFPVTLDAVALTLASTNDPSEPALPLVAVANEPCRFNFGPNGSLGSLVFSKGGVALLRQSAGADGYPALLVPATTVPVASKQGDWVGLSYGTTTSSPTVAVASRVYMTFDANGAVVAGMRCNLGVPCNTWTSADFPVISAGADGIDTTHSSTGDGLAVSFVGTDGRVSMFTTRAGGFTIYSKQYALSLPVLDSVNSFWDSTLNSAGILTDFTPYSVKITGVDTAARTYTRIRLEDNRVDSWQIDTPSTGLRYRPASTGVSESYGMKVAGSQGMVVAMNVNPAQNFYSISVDRP